MAKRKSKETTNETVKNTMYAATNFDTHQVIKSFVIAGLKEPQAEAIVNAIVQSKDYDLSKLATKEQLELVKQQIANLENKMDARITNLERVMATKEDLAKLESLISKQEANILKWVIGTMIALSSVIFAIVKFIH